MNYKALRQFLMEKEAAQSKDPRLARAGVSGYNQVKRTPGHPTKSHIVVAKEGDRVKTIRFGQQGVKTNQTAGQREAFKSRHRKNIARGKMSAAYWADKAKWSPKKTKDKDNQKWVKGAAAPKSTPGFGSKLTISGIKGAVKNRPNLKGRKGRTLGIAGLGAGFSPEDIKDSIRLSLSAMRKRR
jgi:hypothetical protein